MWKGEVNPQKLIDLEKLRVEAEMMGLTHPHPDAPATHSHHAGDLEGPSKLCAHQAIPGLCATRGAAAALLGFRHCLCLPRCLGLDRVLITLGLSLHRGQVTFVQHITFTLANFFLCIIPVLAWKMLALWTVTSLMSGIFDYKKKGRKQRVMKGLGCAIEIVCWLTL